MLHGTIIENSLKDKSILKQVKIVKTWQDDDWILYDILIEKEAAENFGSYLNDGPWYVHFWEDGKDDILVVFKDKTFTIKHSDKNTWQEAINYGKSVGIPPEQLDFVIR